MISHSLSYAYYCTFFRLSPLGTECLFFLFSYQSITSYLVSKTTTTTLSRFLLHTSSLISPRTTLIHRPVFKKRHCQVPSRLPEQKPEEITLASHLLSKNEALSASSGYKFNNVLCPRSELSSPAFKKYLSITVHTTRHLYPVQIRICVTLLIVN